MRVRVLGPIELDPGGAALGPRDRVLLSALAVRLGQTLTAEQLADALWGEHPPPSWHKIVQGCVSRLRRVLGHEAIETTATGYRLVPGQVDLDRVELEALARRGREELRGGSPERAARLFRRALDLWTGTPFLEVEEWPPGRLEAARLSELRLALEEDLLEARLEAGEHREVAADAVVAVGEERWRERRWQLLALAQYRSGRQADALTSIRRARWALGKELGLDPGSELMALEHAILGQDPVLDGQPRSGPTSLECPWKGLASYETVDEDSFFGRTSEVTGALARLDQCPLLVLAGPSGSGKSSLMKAGIAPVLRRRGIPVAAFTPGGDGRTAMAAARASARRDPVLLVDQLEEVFAADTDGRRASEFLDELAAYAERQGPVIVTLRADQMAHLTRSAAFAALAERGLLLVPPLAGAALVQAIEEPARLAGLRLEPGLVDLLLRDAEGQPGALPLLSHALAETWLRREGSLLTVDAYRAAGGIRGAVAGSADRLYASLAEGERHLLRRLMLRMVTVSESSEPVRARLPAQLVAGDRGRRRLLDLLVQGRLVTSDSHSFELAHEALVTAWPRFQAWLEEDTAGQRIQRHLSAAASGWQALGRPVAELYRGARLQEAREWAAGPVADLTPLEREFLVASAAHADNVRRGAERRAEEQRRQNRRLRVLLSGTVVLLALATVVGFLAVDQSRTAARQRDAARVAREAAQHESLVGRSLALRSSNRATAALLAVEAYRSQPDALAESALLGTFTQSVGFDGYLRLPFEFAAGDVVPGTRRAVVAEGSTVRLLELATGELGPRFDLPVRPNTNHSVLRVSADGRRVAQLLFDPEQVDRGCGYHHRLVEDGGRGCTLLTVFEVATGRRLLGPRPTPFAGGDVAIDHSGRLVAVTGGLDGELATYDVATGRLLGRLPGPPRPRAAENGRDTGAVTFRAGTGTVVLGSLSGLVREVDARTLRVRRTLRVPAMSSHNFVAVTDDGRIIAAGDHGIIALDAATGRQLWHADFRQDTDDWSCPSFAVAEDVERFYCGNYYGRLLEYDLRTGAPTGANLDPQLGEVGDLVVTDDNELVGFGRGVFGWRLDGSGPISRLVAPGAWSSAGYDDSGRYLEVQRAGWSGRHRILDLAQDGGWAGSVPDGEVAWIGGQTLLVSRDRGVVLVDPAADRRWRPPGGDVGAVEAAFRGADRRRAWVLSPPASDEEFEIAELDVASGRPTGRTVSLPGHPYVVDGSDDGRWLWVNYWVPGGSYIARTDEDGNAGALIDLASGERRVVTGVAQSALSGVDGVGRLVGGGYSGAASELDPDTLEPIRSLPGSGGFSSFRFDDVGSRLVATSQDGSIQVYDVPTWTRLGTFPSFTSSDAVKEGWLRPDGKALAVNGRMGVAEWDLDPAAWVSAACRIAGRNLSRSEWATHLGAQEYRPTCPEHPSGE